MQVLSPPADSFLSSDSSLEVTLLVPAKNSAHALEATVREAQDFFSARYPGNFEIILIPNPSKADPKDQTLEVARALARTFPESVRVVPHLPVPAAPGGPIPGKGAALRTGLEQARGRWILFTDADLPYDLDFFDRAIPLLREGHALVTGNRRLPTSHFSVPVSLLPLAYGRHRLGLGFNRIVRLLLPIPTTDTQAGIKAMSRALARKAFSRMQCPGFFFDLELFLTARGQGDSHVELPVTLHLNSEKSTVRIVRESLLAAYWLSRIWLRQLRGEYSGEAAALRTSEPARLSNGHE